MARSYPGRANSATSSGAMLAGQLRAGTTHPPGRPALRQRRQCLCSPGTRWRPLPMDTLDLLLTRRSISAKDLTEPGPDAATLQKILAAGIRVPDHSKLGPWRIQVLRKPGQAALGEVLAEIFAARSEEHTSELQSLLRTTYA